LLPSLCLAAALAALAPALAQPAAAPVVVSGTVPDEATRSAILQRVREVYGAERVVDRLGVGPLVAPPNWSQQVQRILTPELRRVSQGELRISGNIVEITGRVENAAQQQQLASQLITQLGNATYTVRNGLRVGGPAQADLDAALADRVIEFEPGRADLTATGRAVLDGLLPLLQQFKGRRFEVVGHTDNDGPRAGNIALSRARAVAVRDYLVSRGVAPGTLVTSGLGPDRPVADNTTPEGRARNRRIEFRVLA
jgi:OOP family OmpA-OmpF porin